MTEQRGDVVPPLDENDLPQILGTHYKLFAAVAHWGYVDQDRGVVVIYFDDTRRDKHGSYIISLVYASSDHIERMTLDPSTMESLTTQLQTYDPETQFGVFILTRSGVIDPRNLILGSPEVTPREAYIELHSQIRESLIDRMDTDAELTAMGLYDDVDDLDREIWDI